MSEKYNVAIALDGPPIKKITDVCKAAKIYACVGYTENRDGKFYNSAFLAGPEGTILNNCSKMHLPYIDVDMFVEPGQPPVPPIETEVRYLSSIICYDVWFPELACYYGLHGADIILHPTTGLCQRGDKRNTAHCTRI